MTQTPETVLTVENLTTDLQGAILHKGLELSLYSGEILGLVGGSGTGKSVLFNTILGLMKPKHGLIKILGTNINKASEKNILAMKKKIGVLFQSSALFSDLTLFENVCMPLIEHTNLSRETMNEIVRLKLSFVGLDKNDYNKFPSELSGGMQKRAGLARALVMDPKILMLDEPTAGLDPISAAKFDALILKLQKFLNFSVLMVTHDLDSLETICDRIAVLVDKKIIADRLENLLENNHPWIKDYFNGPRGIKNKSYNKRDRVNN